MKPQKKRKQTMIKKKTVNVEMVKVMEISQVALEKNGHPIKRNYLEKVPAQHWMAARAHRLVYHMMPKTPHLTLHRVSR